MFWTLSSEQPRAADLAFLRLVPRPTQVQATQQSQRSAGAQLRPCHQVGEPDWGSVAEDGRLGCVGPGPGTAGRRRVLIANGSVLDGQDVQTPTGSAPAFSLRAVDPSRQPLATRRNVQSSNNWSPCLWLRERVWVSLWENYRGLLYTLFAWTP